MIKEYFPKVLHHFLEFLIIETKPASYIQNFTNLLIMLEPYKQLTLDLRFYAK